MNIWILFRQGPLATNTKSRNICVSFMKNRQNFHLLQKRMWIKTDKTNWWVNPFPVKYLKMDVDVNKFQKWVHRLYAFRISYLVAAYTIDGRVFHLLNKYGHCHYAMRVCMFRSHSGQCWFVFLCFSYLHLSLHSYHIYSKFLDFEVWRIFEVGTCWRLGAYTLFFYKNQ